jgi:hypothetical protein
MGERYRNMHRERHRQGSGNPARAMLIPGEVQEGCGSEPGIPFPCGDFVTSGRE